MRAEFVDIYFSYINALANLDFIEKWKFTRAINEREMTMKRLK